MVQVSKTTRLCDFCQLPQPSVHPGGLILCACGAKILIVGDRVANCTREPTAASGKGRPKTRHIADKREPFTEAQIAGLRELIADGARVAEVARAAGVPYHVIQRATVRAVSPGRRMESLTASEVRGRVRDLMDPEATRALAQLLDNAPAVVLPERGAQGHRAVMAQWRSVRTWPLTGELSRFNTVSTETQVSELTVKDAVRRECRRMADEGTDPALIASDLAIPTASVQAALDAYPPGTDIYTAPIARTAAKVTSP
jgi:hypothetical protein